MICERTQTDLKEERKTNQRTVKNATENERQKRKEALIINEPNV